jgi:hypothetical protein
VLERRTVPHDLLEIHVAADFVFEIELFLRELLFQFENLAVSEAILNGDGYLARCLAEKVDLFRRKRTLELACNYEDSDGPTTAHRWY